MPLSHETQIRNQLERWRALWSQTGQGQVYSLADYVDLFVQGEETGGLLVFDSYVPAWATTQINGFDAYRRIWETDVNASFPGWTITRMDILRIEVAASEELAWSALNFWGRGTRQDGTTYEGSQHGTHIWRQVSGQWKIVHEHLTAPITMRGAANAPIDSNEDTAPDFPASS